MQDMYNYLSNKVGQMEATKNRACTTVVHGLEQEEIRTGRTDKPQFHPPYTSPHTKAHSNPRPIKYSTFVYYHIHPSAAFGVVCGRHPQIKFVKRPAPPFSSLRRCDHQPPPSTRHPTQHKSPSSLSRFASTPPSLLRAPPTRSSSPRTTS